MRDRKRDKGVRVCPEVHMSEVAFLEPLENDKESDKEDEKPDEGPKD